MLEIVRQKTSHYLDNTFHALKNRNFRYFWIGQCISLIGTFMQRTAQYWLVYTITDSPLLLGILGVCQFLPIFLLSLFAGPVIDRMQRRQVVIITQLSFMFQAVTLTVLTFTGLVQYWHILILSSIYGITQAFDMPARQTFLFDMVGKDDIMNAVSMNSTIINLAKIIGPALAGMFMLHLGIVMCFLIDSVSYVAVLGSLLMIRVEKAQVQKAKTNILHEIVDGLRYVMNSRTLVIGVFVFSIVATFAMNNDVIIPVFAQDVLGQGAGGYSGLLTAAGLGSLSAALFMASRSKNGVNKYMFIYGAMGTALLQLSAILTANYYVSLVLLFAIGAVNIIFFNTANALFQLNASAEYRSRVMSFYSLLAMGLTPVGNLFAGGVMDGMGGNSGFPACGLLTLLLLALVLIFMRKPISSWMKGKEQNLERK